MAGGAPEGPEVPFTDSHRVIHRTALNRREQPHEVFKIVDPAQAGPAVADVLDALPRRAAQRQRLWIDAERHLVGKQIVGDSHLVTIGVRGECKQCGLLRFPAEPADPFTPGGHVHDSHGPPADAVSVTVIRILQRDDRFIWNGLDQPRPKTGIASRLAITFASAGIFTWQR